MPEPWQELTYRSLLLVIRNFSRSRETLNFLSGNKIDLKDERQVTYLEASRCAQENDILFLETSALTGEGVEEVFVKVARMILHKIEEGLIDPNTMVSGIHTFKPSLEEPKPENEGQSSCSC
eukprot:GHVN01063543.1.p1 GENE.GHVN01063543.1~~GHVN01063543.1.p1  ORF type:complete len:122 (+),score=5.90 GHVN01063543.1:407-772(+)